MFPLNLTYLRLIKKAPKLFKKLGLNSLEKSVQKYYQKSLLQYLYEQNRYLFVDTINQSTNSSSDIVWVCWLQGIENAPPLVKTCITSLQKNHSNVIIIDLKNYDQFIDMPDFLVQKFEKKIIQPAHFSDVLRFALLSQYGGMWIDATYLCINGIPSKILKKKFFTLSSTENFFKKWLPEGKWSCNFIKFGTNDPTPKFIYEALINYWSKNNKVIDYFLLDYIIKLAYQYIPSFKLQLEQNENLADNIFLLAEILFEPITPTNNYRLEQDTIKIYKLSHRVDTLSQSINSTYYEKYILNK